MNRLILVSGFPGSGKTTLITRLADGWGRTNCTGFFTQEKRHGKQRTGFYWETFEGTKGNLADMKPGSPRVGKYRVDLQSFESMLPNLERVAAGKILLIDEVGKMECLSTRFRALVPVWELTQCLRIFTVPSRGTSFIETFKNRHSNELIQLNPTNSDELFRKLSQIL